jgi:hypothetical protein
VTFINGGFGSRSRGRGVRREQRCLRSAATFERRGGTSSPSIPATSQNRKDEQSRSNFSSALIGAYIHEARNSISAFPSLL